MYKPHGREIDNHLQCITLAQLSITILHQMKSEGIAKKTCHLKVPVLVIKTLVDRFHYNS